MYSEYHLKHKFENVNNVSQKRQKCIKKYFMCPLKNYVDTKNN